MLRQLVLSATLLAAPAAVLAQSQPGAAPAGSRARQAAPALTAEQQAEIRKQDATMTQAALQVAQLVDQGQAGKVWDGASSAAKQVAPRDAFVKQVDADRRQVGKLVSRKLAAITRSGSRGGATPAGYYINVSFATQFANEKQPVRELVSFHLDPDKVWRVSGYTLR
jgi:hypothetical protein